MRTTYLYTLLFTITLITIIGCQPPTEKAPIFSNSVAFGGKGDDLAEDLVLDAEGNRIITGSFKSAEITFGETTLYNQSNVKGNDFFLAKINPGGEVLWATGWGGRGSEGGRSLAVDEQGNIYVTGVFISDSLEIDGQILLKSGQGPTTDVFIAKYSPTGKLQWIVAGGGLGNDNGAAIQLNTAGNLVVAGSFQSPVVNMGGKSVLNRTDNGRSDGFVATISPAGEVLALYSFGGTNDELVYDMALSGDGSIYLTGFFSEVMEAGEQKAFSNGGEDMFLLKLDKEGTAQWATSAGGTHSDYGSGLALTADNGVVVAGSMESEKVSFGDILLKNEHNESYFDLGWNFDLFIAKYDATGKALWAKNAHGWQQDYARDVAVSNAGDVYFTGFFKSNYLVLDGDTIKNSAMVSTQEAYLTKLDANGQYQWTIHPDCRGNDQGLKLQMLQDGSLQLLGRQAYPMVLGVDSLPHQGGFDIFITRVNE